METRPPTLEDVLLGLAREWQMLGFAMIVITLVSLIVCYVLQKSNKPLWAHRFMSLPVFLTMIPGIFYCVILAYLLIFARANLLQLPFFTFLPPLWMAISLYLYRQMVDFAYVPGFTRLSGLALFMTVVFCGRFFPGAAADHCCFLAFSHLALSDRYPHIPWLAAGGAEDALQGVSGGR